MFKKIGVVSLMFILSAALFGCSTDGDASDTAKDNTPKDEQNQTIESESNISLEKGNTETIMRKIEGTEEDVEVTTYHIKTNSHHISFHIDESFGAPEVNQSTITFGNKSSKVVLEIMENKSLNDAVAILQEKFGNESFGGKSELKDIPLEENNLNGKMQTFTQPWKGFYAYEVGEHTLVITYEYPGEAGDGMHPLLESLRKSIELE